ncbi:LysR family transcriptional regulator [Roseovarius faecimaris]|nr:LysR family transcriptional regulator [Roseovarius faecimaris]
MPWCRDRDCQVFLVAPEEKRLCSERKTWGTTNLRLPPLNALRAFECAARTGSFTLAAKELGVSSAAVSQHVRNLEAYLDRKLFLRNNNQLQLTDAGRDLYMNAAASLRDISQFTERLLAPRGPAALVISCDASLADRWLPPLLAKYHAAPVELRIEDRPEEMESQNIDIRLGYGVDGYAGYWTKELFHDRLVPLAAPALATRWQSGEAGLRLIQMDWGPSFSQVPGWSDWMGGAVDNHAILRASTGAQVLRLAEAGAGVALGQLTLAREALSEGRLLRLSENSLPLPAPYFAIVAHARLRASRIQAFLAMLTEQD